MMKKLVLVCLLILGVVFGTSCKGSTTPEPPPAKQPPVIVSFTVTPESCLYRESMTMLTLTWNVTGATSVSIDQGIGMVAASGTRKLSPNWEGNSSIAVTTTWTLTASNADGTVSKSCTFTVMPSEYFLVNISVFALVSVSKTYTWNVYFGSDDALLTILNADGSFDPNHAGKTIRASVRMLASLTEVTVPVKWRLMSCSGGSSWADSAVYECWLEATPVSSGIVVEPATLQRLGPFTGWKIGDIKQLSFKIKKS